MLEISIFVILVVTVFIAALLARLSFLVFFRIKLFAMKFVIFFIVSLLGLFGPAFTSLNIAVWIISEQQLGFAGKALLVLIAVCPPIAFFWVRRKYFHMYKSELLSEMDK